MLKLQWDSMTELAKDILWELGAVPKMQLLQAWKREAELEALNRSYRNQLAQMDQALAELLKERMALRGRVAESLLGGATLTVRSTESAWSTNGMPITVLEGVVVTQRVALDGYCLSDFLILMQPKDALKEMARIAAPRLIEGALREIKKDMERKVGAGGS